MPGQWPKNATRGGKTPEALREVCLSTANLDLRAVPSMPTGSSHQVLRRGLPPRVLPLINFLITSFLLSVVF